MNQIIPYQELLGNYDVVDEGVVVNAIIPYQELLGNYDIFAPFFHFHAIIPYQELLGNYDVANGASCAHVDYTIPRAIREL